MTARPARRRPLTTRACVDCGRPIRRRHARYCDHCRWKHRRGKIRKYVWTEALDQLLRDRYDGTVRNRAQELADRLGWPRWVIIKRAALLGLGHPQENRKAWTSKEVAFLEEWARRRHVNWLAKKLGRSITSTVLKLKRLKIRRRVSQGYTLRMLETCFGTDHHVIERWMREGKLSRRRRNPDAPHDQPYQSPWLFEEADVLQFIRKYPLAFRLDKVDQAWFMDLALGAGLLKAEAQGTAA